MYTTLVLAMTADGKIANADRAPAKFSSAADFRHLEEQVAASDAVLIGAGTLRVHGTTMRVLDPLLIQARIDRGQSPQPIQIACSTQGHLERSLPFFRQPVSRWLVAAQAPIENSGFDRVFVIPDGSMGIDWLQLWMELPKLGIDRLCILGGARLATVLWEKKLIDEFQLTICPMILGGAMSPTPCLGLGFPDPQQLQLIDHRIVGDEVFLQYRRKQ
jgi:5-amino-6-(5-phosphoribosylamino)uracil reductase